MDKYKKTILNNFKDFYEPLHLALSPQSPAFQNNFYWDLTTPNQLADILHRAPISPKVFTSQDMILLVDTTFISKEYSSLVFSLSGQVFKSPEETRGIFQRIEAQAHMPYSWSKVLGQSLGYDHKIPYVTGSFIYIPDRGPSKQNVSWLALHHIMDYLSHASNQQILLKTTGNGQFNLSFDVKIFEKQVSRAKALYSIQYSLLRYLAESFQIRDLNLNPRTNIMQSQGTQSLLHKADFSFENFFTYLLAYHTNEQIKEIIREDNPYFEDLQDLLRSRLEDKA